MPQPNYRTFDMLSLQRPHHIYRKTFLVCLALVCGQAFALADEAIKPETVDLGRPVDFLTDIAPIFRANCVACHNKAKSEGQLILEDVASILKGGSSGDIVVPGKPDDSYLYNVAARIEESYMPPMPNEVQAKPLSAREVGLLRQWIVEGAKAGSSATSANISWQAINTGLNAIYAVDTDPFGRFVAAGRAGNVNIYDMLAKDNVASLTDPDLDAAQAQQQAHRDYVHAIAFHPDGQMLATAGYRVVKLWSRTPANTIKKWDGATEKVDRVCSSRDRTVAAVQTEDGAIACHSATGQVYKLPGEKTVGSTLLGIGGAGNKFVVVSGTEGQLKLIDVSSGQDAAISEPSTLQLSQAVVIADKTIVALATDGTLQRYEIDATAKKLVPSEPVKSAKGPIKQIHLSAANLMCRIEGNTVEILNPDSLSLLKTIQMATPSVSATVSNSGDRLVTIGTEGSAELWNTADGKRIAKLSSDLTKSRALIQQTANKAVRDARVKVVQGQITEDEKRVKEQNDSLKKSEEEVKKATEALVTAKKKADAEAPKVAAAKKASDEKPDDAGLKKKLEAATAAQQKEKDAVLTAENTLQSANKGVELSKQAIKRAESKVNERKQLLARVEADAKTAADRQKLAEEASKSSVTATMATFVGDGFVATIDDSGTTRLWNSADGKPVDVFTASLPADAKPSSICGSNGAVIVSQANGQTSVVNLFPKWKLIASLGPAGEGKASAFADRILSLAFSPDGTLLAAGGGEASRSGELTIWDVAERKLIRTIADAHSDTVYGLDFSRDGKLLASAAADKFVKVFDVSNGKHVRSYEGHTHHVMDVSWNGDGTKLVSAGADNAIKVWNAETGEQSRTITTYKKQVTSLEFIGMQDEFISCSGDKRVFRHRAANGGTVREFKGCPDYVYCSATTTDGLLVAAGCEDGVLRIWNGKDGKEIASFAATK